MSKPAYLSRPFVEAMMRQHAPEKAIQVVDCEPFALDNSASILATLTAGTADRLIGHFGLTVTYVANGVRQTQPMVMKIKPPGSDIVAMLSGLARACGSPLAEVYPAFQEHTGFGQTHRRELAVYSKLPATLQPTIFGLFADTEHDTYLILMEYLDRVDLMNSVMAPDQWTDRHIREALDQLAGWHADHLNKPLPIDPAYWRNDVPGLDYMQQLTPLWDALLTNAAEKFPALYHPDRVTRLRSIIRSIPAYWQELEQMNKTLIHNDLNPRNTCFKRTPGGLSFCVYDWELATYHVPQYDVVELLCFVLDVDRYALRPLYLAHYRQALHQRTGLYTDERAFFRGAELAAFDFGIHRLGLYMMAHSVGPYPFLPRVVDSYFDTIDTLFSNRA